MLIPLSVLELRDRTATYFGAKVGVVDGQASFTCRTHAEQTRRTCRSPSDPTGA